MIRRVYRLVDVKRIEMVQRELDLPCGAVLVRPDYLAICAADQRYYQGKRKKEILQKKLPMALIHEAVGTVLRDAAGVFSPGEKVALVPNLPARAGEVKENYLPDSVFLSSGADGFMQDLVALRRDRLVHLPEGDEPVYVLTELVSVAFNAIEAFETCRKTRAHSLGVWGDGSVGFVTALALKCAYPAAKVRVFGKSLRKLQRFSFADDVFLIDALPEGLRVDHAFECVGGRGSETALAQIAERVAPEGCVLLLGVSEEPVAVPTRAVLEKGLRLIGCSRSGKADFEKAVALIQANPSARRYLKTLISEIVDVESEAVIAQAFAQDMMNDFKTVLRWRL